MAVDLMDLLWQATRVAGCSQAPSFAQQCAILRQQQVMRGQSLRICGTSIHITGRAQGRGHCELRAEWQVGACAHHRPGRKTQLVCHRRQVCTLVPLLQQLCRRRASVISIIAYMGGKPCTGMAVLCCEEGALAANWVSDGIGLPECP